MKPSVIGGKFKLIRKLGRGAYSSAWLAESQGICKGMHTRYQALKVLTVDATAGLLHDQYPEFDNLVNVTTKSPNHPAYGGFPGTLAAAVQTSLAATKKMIKQILLALGYIHTECGLVHTVRSQTRQRTNFSWERRRWQRGQTNKWLHKENPSETYKRRFERDISPEPIITVKSHPLPNIGLNPDLSNLRVKLCDFGSALALTPEQLLIGRTIQPEALRAPEILLAHPWSTPVDIWSLGCSVRAFTTSPHSRLKVFGCLVRVALFGNEYRADQPLYTNVQLLRITQLLGPLPPRFLANCDARAGYFDENGGLLRAPKVPSMTTEACLDNYKCLEQEELRPAADFIRSCLTIDLSVRPTAKELLKDKWLGEV